MKKFRIAIIMLVFILALSACSSSNQGSESNQENISTSEKQKQSGNQEQKVDFPNKPIRIIVPFAPGGTADTAARILAGVIHDHLPSGQTVVIENLEGGGGSIGMTEVFRSEADGYTIALTTSGPVVVKPHEGQTAYTSDDFKPVMQITSTPNVFVVNEKSPWQTFEDWLEYVEANPGQFTYGIPGAGLTQHIAMENFILKTGLDLTNVPYDGGGPTTIAVLGEHVMGAILAVNNVLPYIEDGTLRPLFLAGTNKPEELSDVPLLIEKGIDVGGDLWTGVFAPKDVPDEIIEILETAFKEALEEPEVIEQFSKMGTPPVFKSSVDFKKTIDADNEANSKVLESLGLKK